MNHVTKHTLMHTIRSYVLIILPILMVVLSFFVTADSAIATVAATPACTNDASFSAPDQFLMSEISSFVEVEINTAAEQLFNGLVRNNGFLYAVSAAFTLYVAIFALMFLFGIVPLTLGQGVIRLAKVAVIMVVISPAGWTQMNNTLGKFFNDGTDELIANVMTIAVDTSILGGPGAGGGGGSPSRFSSVNWTGVCSGYTPGGTTTPPFCILDVTFKEILAPKTIIQLVTAAATGPFGLAMAAIMGVGVITLMLALLEALKIYIIAIIAKALLFGLAPIFFAFLLFERTKQIFFGWLNMVINFSLQPLLLFTFFSFYIVLMDQTMTDMLGVEICWGDFAVTEGQPEKMKFWRFAADDGAGGKTFSTDWTWEGAVACLQSGSGATCPDFPMGIESLLIFFLLAHLAYQFNAVVVTIATELSGSTVFLNKAGRESYFSAGTGSKGLFG